VVAGGLAAREDVRMEAKATVVRAIDTYSRSNLEG